MRFAAAAIIAVLAAPAALAGPERCQEPFGPVVPDGRTATQAEMRDTRAQVLKFIKDSDAFQTCLVLVMDDPKEELKEAQKRSIIRKIDSNQREKEEVGAAYNAALRAFRARGLTLE